MPLRGSREVLSVVLGGVLTWPFTAGAASPAAPPLAVAVLGVRVGPGAGNGQRQVAAPTARPAGSSADTSQPRERSRRPITPVDLPPGPDAELKALKQAERRLFARPLHFVPAFASETPSPIPKRGPELNVTGLPVAITASTPSPATSEPSRARSSWPAGLSLPNLPLAFEQTTLDYIRFYKDSARGRAIAENWARKLGRYGPSIVAELSQNGLPTDLVYLSLIESGHNPTITSSAGAAGLWQFIPESARAYGLAVDRWVDERLDPVRSTRAAARLLRDLEQRFGSWDLAMAAYNMGHQGLARSIRKYNTNDFWRLARLEAALPLETALYVPKVLAIAVVLRNKAAFGLGNVQPEPPLSIETVLVPPGISLAKIASRAGVPREEISSLNPHYLTARTPPASPEEPARRWAVHVPRGRGHAVARWLADPANEPRYSSYRFRRGDTLAIAAARTGVSEGELRALNGISAGETLGAGTLLLLPPAADARARLADNDVEEIGVVPPARFNYEDRERVFYRTVPGDSASEVARAFQVSSGDLVRWNGLDARAHLQSDMLLQVYVPRGQHFEDVRVIRERNLRKQLEVGTPDFFAHFEGAQGRQRLRIAAREGDTLSSIGKRYGLSAGTMERINHFSRNRRLAAGTPVTVYAKYGPSENEMLLSRTPDPLPPVLPPYPSALPSVRGRKSAAH